MDQEKSEKSKLVAGWPVSKLQNGVDLGTLNVPGPLEHNLFLSSYLLVVVVVRFYEQFVLLLVANSKIRDIKCTETLRLQVHPPYH